MDENNRHPPNKIKQRPHQLILVYPAIIYIAKSHWPLIFLSWSHMVCFESKYHHIVSKTPCKIFILFHPTDKSIVGIMDGNDNMLHIYRFTDVHLTRVHHSPCNKTGQLWSFAVNSRLLCQHTTLSSLVAPQAVLMTTYGVTSDDEVVKLTTFCFQCFSGMTAKLFSCQ